MQITMGCINQPIRTDTGSTMWDCMIQPRTKHFGTIGQRKAACVIYFKKNFMSGGCGCQICLNRKSVL